MLQLITKLPKHIRTTSTSAVALQQAQSATQTAIQKMVGTLHVKSIIEHLDQQSKYQNIWNSVIWQGICHPRHSNLVLIVDHTEPIDNMFAKPKQIITAMLEIMKHHNEITYDRSTIIYTYMQCTIATVAAGTIYTLTDTGMGFTFPTMLSTIPFGLAMGWFILKWSRKNDRKRVADDIDSAIQHISTIKDE